MSLLGKIIHGVENAVGIQQQNPGAASQQSSHTALPVQGIHAQVLGNNTPAAHQYNQAMRQGNYNSPAVVGPTAQDPANFGYGPDATLTNNAGVPGSLLVGVPNMTQLPQGNQFNPGFTPLQNSGFGPRGNPQIGAFNNPTMGRNRINPQLSDNGYFWDN